MKTAKQVWIEIIRRPFRSLLMCFTVFVLALFTVFGSFIRGIVGNIYQSFVRMEGYSIDVQVDAFNELSDWNKVLAQFMEMEHVDGYNNTIEMKELCAPVNFKNVDYYGNEISDVQSEEDEMVWLVGNCDTKYYSSFRNEEMKLVEGVFPSLGNPGVAVDKNVAKTNNLHIGDEICVSLYDMEMCLNIMGIYETFDIPRVETEKEGYYKDSINSFLFCDYENYIRLTGKSDISIMRFFIDAYENMEACQEKMAVLTAGQNALVVNTIQNHMNDTGSMISFLKNCSGLVLGFNYVASVVILGLMILLWLRSHKQMIMIYKILGQNVLKISGKIVCEIFLLEAVSGVFGFLVACLVLHNHGKEMIDWMMTISGNRTALLNLGESVELYSFHVPEALGFVVVLLFVSILFSFLAGVYVSGMRVRDLRRM